MEILITAIETSFAVLGIFFNGAVLLKIILACHHETVLVLATPFQFLTLIYSVAQIVISITMLFNVYVADHDCTVYGLILTVNGYLSAGITLELAWLRYKQIKKLPATFEPSSDSGMVYLVLIISITLSIPPAFGICGEFSVSSDNISCWLRTSLPVYGLAALGTFYYHVMTLKAITQMSRRRERAHPADAQLKRMVTLMLAALFCSKGLDLVIFLLNVFLPSYTVPLELLQIARILSLSAMWSNAAINLCMNWQEILPKGLHPDPGSNTESPEDRPWCSTLMRTEREKHDNKSIKSNDSVKSSRKVHDRTNTIHSLNFSITDLQNSPRLPKRSRKKKDDAIQMKELTLTRSPVKVHRRDKNDNDNTLKRVNENSETKDYDTAKDITDLNDIRFADDTDSSNKIKFADDSPDSNRLIDKFDVKA